MQTGGTHLSSESQLSINDTTSDMFYDASEYILSDDDSSSEEEEEEAVRDCSFFFLVRDGVLIQGSIPLPKFKISFECFFFSISWFYHHLTLVVFSQSNHLVLYLRDHMLN